MGTQWEDGSYSAEVEIYLLADGQKFAVAQIGPNSLILREPGSVQNGRARIVIRVDGREEIHDVTLHSADPNSSELAYA